MSRPFGPDSEADEYRMYVYMYTYVFLLLTLILSFSLARESKIILFFYYFDKQMCNILTVMSIS